MGRQTSPTTPGLAGICNVCRRSCITMDEVGLACWFCGRGVFLHRQFWSQRLCPRCHGDGLCPHCEKGLLIEPSHEPAVLARLAACLIDLERRYAAGEAPNAVQRWVALGRSASAGGYSITDVAHRCFDEGA